MLTPLQLGILLHYHVTNEKYQCQTMTHVDQREELINDGLLEEREGHIANGEDNLRMSSKGRVFMNAILNTPLPVMEWRIPR